MRNVISSPVCWIWLSLPTNRPSSHSKCYYSLRFSVLVVGGSILCPIPGSQLFLYRDSIQSALIGNKRKIFIQPQKVSKYSSKKLNLDRQVVSLVLDFGNIKHFHFEFMTEQKVFLVHG